jgi:hypothetical protein
MPPLRIPTYTELAGEATSAADEARRRLAAARDAALNSLVADATQRGNEPDVSRQVALGRIDRRVTPVVGRWDDYFAGLPESNDAYLGALGTAGEGRYQQYLHDIDMKLSLQQAMDAVNALQRGGGGGGGGGRGRRGGGGGTSVTPFDPYAGAGGFLDELLAGLYPNGQTGYGDAPIFNRPPRQPTRPLRRPAPPRVTGRPGSGFTPGYRGPQ